MELITAKTALFVLLWFLSVALLYWIIKTAVSNGVREANARLLESVREIEKSVHAIMRKESN